MRIAALTVYRVRIPLAFAFRHSRASRSEADNIVVEASTDEGRSGFGEGVPREYVTGETPPSALRYLERLDYAFLRSPWESMPEAVRALRAWEAAEEGNGGPFPGAARCAISLALLDAIGKRWGCGAGEAAAAAGAAHAAPDPRAEVRYSAVCSGGRRIPAALSFLKFRLYGFRAVKVKLGWGEDRDVALVREARALLGRGTDIRADANGAWDLAAALRVIPRLARLGVSSIEEPLSPAERGRLPELRRRVEVPIMLDESVRSLADLRRAAASGGCDMVNIRLSKCGGFFSSLAMAEEARRRGIGAQLGCQVGETGILSAAGRQFAFLVPGLRHLEGSYDRHLLRENLTEEDPTFGRGGRAGRLPGPGLGVTVDRAALARHAVEERKIAL